jgi:hypothetical protein
MSNEEETQRERDNAETSEWSNVRKSKKNGCREPGVIDVHAPWRGNPSYCSIIIFLQYIWLNNYLRQVNHQMVLQPHQGTEIGDLSIGKSEELLAEGELGTALLTS